jgi:methylenetetrahydrofolate dehydrogenase (NADP+)/methenyltetrahydrofolate cyclohydrolase
MPAQILDGRAIAARIRDRTAELVSHLRRHGVTVRLEAVIAGDSEASKLYAKSQESRCREVGIEYRVHALPAEADQGRIIELIRQLNQDPSVTGILLNLPLPAGIDTMSVQYAIDPYKDVEGVNPANIGLLFYDRPIIAPCTALAVMEILQDAGVKPKGLDAVVVGQGSIAGRPISLFLLHEMATVSACHEATRDLGRHTRGADLLITAAGVPGLIRAEHIKPGAIVIDVGISQVSDGSGGTRIAGDVRFDEVAQVAGAITPVPGGVGPVTVAILMASAAQAAAKQHGAK